MRVLLVEDSERLQAAISRALSSVGYAVDSATDGERGLACVLARDYDVVVLDLMLPKLDGASLLRTLRQKGRDVHVLILTARDTVADRVRGLREGADDYLVKPFAMDELIARVDALARRSRGHKSSRVVIGALAIDTSTKTATVDGKSLNLTPREYRVLEYLAFHRGRPVPRDEIEAHVYDEHNAVWSNAIDSTICALRAKLEPFGAESLIRTRRRLGWVLEGEPIDVGNSGEP